MCRLRSKENPSKIDEIESDKPSEKFVKMETCLAPKSVNDGGKTVQGSPNDECPAGSMPDTTDKEDKEKIDTSPGQSTTTSSERDVDVIFKPS